MTMVMIIVVVPVWHVVLKNPLLAGRSAEKGNEKVTLEVYRPRVYRPVSCVGRFMHYAQVH